MADRNRGAARKPRGVQFKKGNTVAVTHGATSPRMIEARAAEIRERIEAEIAAVPYLTAPDAGIVRRYVWLSAQAQLIQEGLEATGGMVTSRGTERKGALLLMRVHRLLLETEKVLGLGAAPRAGVMRDMSGAHVGRAQVLAIQDRLREKQVRLLESPDDQADTEAS